MFKSLAIKRSGFFNELVFKQRNVFNNFPAVLETVPSKWMGNKVKLTKTRNLVSVSKCSEMKNLKIHNINVDFLKNSLHLNSL